MQDYNSLTKDIFPLFPFERKQKDGTISNSARSVEFSKAKNLYITGHSNGAINFWDVSCPLLLPIVSLTQQVIHYHMNFWYNPLLQVNKYTV